MERSRSCVILLNTDGGLRTAQRQIEDGQVEKVDILVMSGRIVQRSLGRVFIFSRCAEQQVNISGDAGLFKIAQYPGRRFQSNALFQGVKNPLIPGFQSDFEHYAARRGQLLTEARIVQGRSDAHKAVPGGLGRGGRQSFEQRR